MFKKKDLPVTSASLPATKPFDAISISGYFKELGTVFLVPTVM